jgi:hypothetical protein
MSFERDNIPKVLHLVRRLNAELLNSLGCAPIFLTKILQTSVVCFLHRVDTLDCTTAVA